MLLRSVIKYVPNPNFLNNIRSWNQRVSELCGGEQEGHRYWIGVRLIDHIYKIMMLFDLRRKSANQMEMRTNCNIKEHVPKKYKVVTPLPLYCRHRRCQEE